MCVCAHGRQAHTWALVWRPVTKYRFLCAVLLGVGLQAPLGVLM